MVFVNKNIIVKNNDAVEQMLNNSSLIRQECESQNRCYKKKKQAKFPKNEHFLPPDTVTCVYVYMG